MLVLLNKSLILSVDLANFFLEELDSLRTFSVGLGLDQGNSLVDVVCELVFKIELVLTPLPHDVVGLELDFELVAELSEQLSQVFVFLDKFLGAFELNIQIVVLLS